MVFVKTPLPKEIVKQKLRDKKKASKLLLKEKRARLIIRNLPYKATEENLREYFEKFGEIANIDLLTRSDGKFKGCGFIQFKLVQKAAKARHHTNGKNFLGRDLNVDFAQSKDKYKKEILLKKEEEIKKEEDVKVKDEVVDVDEDDDEEKELKIDEDRSDDDEEEEKESEGEIDEVIEVEEKRKPHFANDVSEGRTIFIKNVPFDATNASLKECMSQFGPLYYALICMDKMTEHSKGTAFVKFQQKEDAEKALEAGTELTLLGNVLDCHLALGKSDVQKKISDHKEKKNEPKDSRNLYLVKEGVILAGTKAAVGVSASDMAKRLQLEQYKSQMLRNLNMFVSRDRLIVHNLPAAWDDKKLRTLFQKFAGEGAVIKESRIMRDMRSLDAQGVGTSKEFGFVGFKKHEHALNALRALNNNPNVFSAGKRPIVAFSIESKAMVKAKFNRMEKSRQKNPICKSFVKGDVSKNKTNKAGTSKAVKNDVEGDLESFAGVAAKAGVPQKMRSRYKLTTQAQLHYENLKKEKKQKKNVKKSLADRKKDFIKQDKQKIVNKKIEGDGFSKMVNDYKQKLTNADGKMKTKWYA